MSGTQVKVVKASASAVKQSTNSGVLTEGEGPIGAQSLRGSEHMPPLRGGVLPCSALVEKLSLPSVGGQDPRAAAAEVLRERVENACERLHKLETSAATASKPEGYTVIKASITLEPATSEAEIFRISTPAGAQGVYSVWVESSTGPIGGFIYQVITSDTNSAVVAFSNLTQEPREVRVCLGISP